MNAEKRPKRRELGGDRLLIEECRALFMVLSGGTAGSRWAENRVFAVRTGEERHLYRALPGNTDGRTETSLPKA